MLSTSVYKFLCGCMFSIFLGIHIFRSGIPVACSYSIFNIQKICQTTFQSCTILHPDKQCMRVLISPHLCQHLLSDFLITDILVDVKWYLRVALISISLITNDAEYQLIGMLI